MGNPTPAIEFRVNLTLKKTEIVNHDGSTAAMLHPDRFSEDQDAAVESIDYRKNLRSTFIPGLSAANNHAMKHGDTFTEYGQKAVYLRATYGIGYAPADQACLDVVSVS